jgi:hypothetical protein
MNTNKSRGFVRFVAGPVAAAAILGGAALGFAAGANASTDSPEQMKQQHAAEVQARNEARQPGGDTRSRTPTPPPHRVQPKSPTAPGEHPARKA